MFHVPGQTRSEADTPALSDARRALTLAISHESERKLHYSEPDLLATALGFARTSGLDDIQQVYKDARKSGELALVNRPMSCVRVPRAKLTP